MCCIVLFFTLSLWHQLQLSAITTAHARGNKAMYAMKTNCLPTFSKTLSGLLILFCLANACSRSPANSAPSEHFSPVITLGLSVNAKLNHSNNAPAVGAGKVAEKALPNLPDEVGHVKH